MKKALFAGVLTTCALFLATSVNASPLSDFTKPGYKMVWEHVGTLPAQKGYETNAGVAGLLQGTIGDYIVVGGGANFPDKPLEEGGGKVTHKDLYLLQEVDGQLKTIDQIQLDWPIGYGASADVPEEKAVYYFGGSPDKGHEKDILKVTVVKGKLQVEVVAQMPLAFQNGVASYYKGKIYYGVGKFFNGEKIANGKKFFAYDLRTKKVETLPDFPGEARQQTVGQILDGKYYIFSGGSNVSYVDGYSYDLAKGTWSPAADVIINDKKVLLLGANSIKLNDSQMLVVGGFNYQLWNDANFYLSNLKGNVKDAYKAQYFSAEPNSYNWNRDILVYDAKVNKWFDYGTIPFQAPCGEALIKLNDAVYSINGEIKPGVRTDSMYKGIVIPR